MGRLAVIGKVGTFRARAASAPVATPPPIGVRDHGTHATLYRHGLETQVPPRRIDHAADLRTLVQLGCDRVVALGPVGSPRVDLPAAALGRVTPEISG